MKCFLIGSEKDLLESLEAYILTHFFYIEVLEKVNSYSEAEKILPKIKPDLVLIDITSSLEAPLIFLKKILEFSVHVIAITPINQSIICNLKKNNIAYITKPLEYIELRLCINVFYANKYKEKELQQFLGHIHSTAPKKRIAVHQEKQIQMISTEDILYIKADINYCQIHTVNNDSICVSKTLKSLEEQLINNNEFYRIHQSYLINLNHIKKIIKTKLPQVVMTNGDILTISRSKKTIFYRLILK